MVDEVGRARELLATLGGSGARAGMRAWTETLGPDSAAALLDALREPGSDEPPPDFNGRAYVEELEDCVHALARRFPQALLGALESREEMLSRLAVIGPVSHLRDPRVTRWLRQALESRDGSQRWVGLRGLLARHDPEVIERLADIRHFVARAVGPFPAADRAAEHPHVRRERVDLRRRRRLRRRPGLLIAPQPSSATGACATTSASSAAFQSFSAASLRTSRSRSRSSTIRCASRAVRAWIRSPRRAAASGCRGGRDRRPRRPRTK